MRKVKFIENEYYHLYNRGVDKRSIFQDKEDALRFLQSMQEFNSTEPQGGIYLSAHSKNSNFRSSASKLVRFIAYCLNQNHYHFIIQPLVEDGVQKFMHRLSTGYTKFFNEKHKRSGSLFQGSYKAVHIETNEQLLHGSVYVNINDRVHEGLNEKWLSELPFSSFAEYQGIRKNGICDTSIILDQYQDSSEYSKNAELVLIDIINRKKQEKLLKKMMIE
jgi:putative transposase